MESRVKREKAAHNEDGVLEAAYRLKERFPHVSKSLTMQRCEQDFSQLTHVKNGQRMLEIGCGFGDQCLVGLRQGGQVCGIDISERFIETACSRARDAGFSSASWEFRVMDAHHLEYESNTFDFVFGKGILHHLDLVRSVAEVHRVLKNGGFGVFLEPLADNPLLKLFRRLTPKARTVDEQPLRRSDLDLLTAKYTMSMRYYGLVAAPLAMFTSIVFRPWPNNLLLKYGDLLDQRLGANHVLGPFSQYVLFTIRK